MLESSGFITFHHKGEKFRTWYNVVGDVKKVGSQPPLVILHGGPSIPNPYMSPHKALHSTLGAPVIFYDQIGGGKSTHLRDKPPSFWTPDLFVAELENVLAHFGISDRFDLLGHSWGGMLAAYFACTRRPQGLQRLVIANSPASMETLNQSINKLLERFPKDVVARLRRYEKEGTTDNPEYLKWKQVFQGKHVCTLDPWPADLRAGFAKMEEDTTVYNTMFGPNAFNIIGTLRSYSVVGKLGAISVPTLVMNGAEDETQDECIKPFVDEIPDVKWVKLEKSSHMPFYEESERYMEVVGTFLRAKEIRRSRL